MSEQKREKIKALIDQLETIDFDIEAIFDEEYEAFEGLLKDVKETEEGQAMQEIIGFLGSARSSLSEAINALNEVVNA